MCSSDLEKSINLILPFCILSPDSIIGEKTPGYTNKKAGFFSCLRVSKKSTLSWSRMPFARKSKIFGLHSLLLRYPKKKYALSAYFFRPRRHNKLFYPATGGNRLLSSANTTPVPLKNRLLSGFSLTRCFFDAPVAEKTKCG